MNSDTEQHISWHGRLADKIILDVLAEMLKFKDRAVYIRIDVEKKET